VGNIKLISGKGRNSRAQAVRDYASGSRAVRQPGSRPAPQDDTKPVQKAGARSTAPKADTGPVSKTGSKSSGSQAAKPAKPAVKLKKKRKTGVITAVVIIVIFLGGITALVVSLGVYVDKLETVLPDVWVDGIKLSGMTLEEATQALIDAGYESNASNVSATIIFPDDSGFTITGDEVGFALDAREAAQAAYGYGREGSLLQRSVAYVRSLMGRTDLEDLSASKFDEGFVRGVVTVHTKAFNDALVEDFFKMTNEQITVIKGTGVMPASEESVFHLAVTTLQKALEQHTHLTERYVPETADVIDVDLDLLYDTIRIDPVNSVYDPSTFGATESSPGVSFDKVTAQALLDSASVGEEVVIRLFTIEPEVKREDIEVLLFRDILAEKSTRVSGTANRRHNVELAASLINEHLMNPMDVFSYNDVVGQRTAERGFREANAYANGRIIQEIGGGICQVSSTIYYTLLHTDLEIVERWEHGMTVSYIQLGSDATVDWRSKDLRFRNNTDYPIRVETEYEGRDLVIRIIGTKFDDNYYEVKYETISVTPFVVVEQQDATVAPGRTVVDHEGTTGYVVDTYRYLYDSDDNLISKSLVVRSRYRATNRIILIPIAPAETSPPTDPTPSDPDPSPTPSDPDPSLTPANPTPTPSATDPPPDPDEVDDIDNLSPSPSPQPTPSPEPSDDDERQNPDG